jgi:hypothetical protein
VAGDPCTTSWQSTGCPLRVQKQAAITAYAKRAGLIARAASYALPGVCLLGPLATMNDRGEEKARPTPSRRSQEPALKEPALRLARTTSSCWRGPSLELGAAPEAPLTVGATLGHVTCLTPTDRNERNKWNMPQRTGHKKPR